MNIRYEDDPCGGKGHMRLEELLTPAEMGDKCSFYARVILPPGGVLGFHMHPDNNECYYFLSGEGVYDDNGVKRPVKPGDVTWTPAGTGHGLDNSNGTEPIVFMALIINS